jgi:hypothetical protein
MIRLERAKTLLERAETSNRRIRKDDPEDLAISNWDLVSRAIKAGKVNEALEFLEYTRVVSQATNDSFVSGNDKNYTYIANNYGEEEVLKILKPRYHAMMKEFLSTIHGTEEILQRCTEFQRGHHANFTVKEEPDKYVVTYDPCGSGGRLRRTRSVGVTKQAYPWSWGKGGVPYYCTHCCMHFEIIPIELQGYPVRVNLIADKPEDPCVHLFYKKPELIPEEYFKRVGMKKDPVRFKR